ncbi:MAG: MTAP family purine nucleoside phosphorylase [Chloroflexaceae bacterium]|nr:MTAP family purine nucleoside phosphorylase [Chloroflexaceae bacterium]
MILILGGTAAYHLDLSAELGAVERIDQETPYGRAFPILRLLNAPGNTALAFASRHGLEQLDLTPPFVNARANLWAAHALGVQAIVSWNGVGAINPLLEVGDLLVLNHLLDMTRTRVRSFDPAPPLPTRCCRINRPLRHCLFLTRP